MTILEQLPERVYGLALQIVQLREEMRAEFSAVREEARAGDEATRHALREEIQIVTTHARVLPEGMKSALKLLEKADRPARDGTFPVRERSADLYSARAITRPRAASAARRSAAPRRRARHTGA